MWCRSCAKNVPPKNMDGKICCPHCGRVLDEDNFSQEPVFVKNAAGQSQMSGNFVRTIQNEYSASRERILDEASRGIDNLMYSLGIDGGDSIVRPALAFYTIALERNFTRGRRKEQVEAACLYIACREHKKPYLLIDFSEHLRINVYVLGAVFLQLCKVLSLEEHPIIQKPVDPSLFIHRFTDRLFGGKKTSVTNVSRTALHIVASMKRDWMQTGRKPSGLCGAALYIAALSHGLKCSKNEIIKVVHVCETTLTKRLIEFENTESGGLTIDEFNAKAVELEQEERLSNSLNTGVKASGINELLCKHKGSRVPHFAHGLCESCYGEFIKLSGGLEGGSEPPAFQRAERERMMAKEAAADKSSDLDSSILSGSAENQREALKYDKPNGPKDVTENEVPQPTKPGLSEDDLGDCNNGGTHTVDADLEEPESLSDIDDQEVDFYLHNEEEIQFKTFIWEKMNKEYLEEQAAKEADALAAKKAYEEAFANCSEDVKEAQRIAAAAAASVAKAKKEKRQKRAAELKTSDPAQTAAEATKQVLDKKRLNSKIRHDVLEQLFQDSENPEKMKKQKSEGVGEAQGEDDRYSSLTSKGGEEGEEQQHDIDDYTYSDFIEQEHDYDQFEDFY